MRERGEKLQGEIEKGKQSASLDFHLQSLSFAGNRAKELGRRQSLRRERDSKAQRGRELPKNGSPSGRRLLSNSVGNYDERR